MQAAGSNKAVERVWRAFSAEVRDALTVEMTPTDLQTLLLSVAQTRARQVDVARLMRQWTEDRFVRPAAADPRRLAALDCCVVPHKAANDGRFGRFGLRSWLCAEKRKPETCRRSRAPN
jgi:hypothetical protein